MSFENRIIISASLVPKHVEIINTRMVMASETLKGRPVADAVKLIPILFSICGTAQGICAVMAAESALGLSVTAEVTKARAMALAAERIADHGLTIARDWPQLLGLAPDLVTGKQLFALSRLRQRLFESWTQPGGSELLTYHWDGKGLTSVVSTMIGGDLPLIANDYQAFTDWLKGGSSIAAKAINKGLQLGPWQARLNPLPLTPSPETLKRMADRAFCAHPVEQDETRETGPLARMKDHTMIRQLLADFGPNVGVRMAARLVEMHHDITNPDLTCADLADWPVAGEGIAFVQATRGQLIHHLAVKDGVISTYNTLAPTEWNFHPKGILAQAIAGLDDLDADQIRWMVSAMDACVETHVKIQDFRTDSHHA